MTDRTAVCSTILEKYADSASLAAQMNGAERDEYFMQAALDLARAAALDGEVPVGCVITDRDYNIIAGDFNGRETFRDALYHAESSAIRKASEKLVGWRLVGCTLYVTLEPCPMCSGACWAARVPRIVIGTKDARAGAMGSLINLNAYPLNHKPEVTFGVLEKECRAVLQDFFSRRRNEKKAEKEKRPNEKEKKTLFISDLDGTLLDRYAALPHESAQKLNQLAKDGAMITYATARTIRSVTHILGEIDFSADSCCPIALMNGVLIRDMKLGKYVSAAVIEKNTAAEIIRIFDAAGAEPFIYTIDENDSVDGDPLHTYYRRVINEPMRRFLDERVGKYQKPFLKLDSLSDVQGDIIYCCVIGGEELIRKSADSIAGLKGIRYTYYRDSYDEDTWYLEVFDESASKAHAVDFLRKYTGADEIVCFGDNMNDLPMFERSDIRVAVEGAVGEVKKRADHTVKSVPDFIEKYYYKNKR